MQKENQTYKVAPADRLAGVSEYYFSKKLKEGGMSGLPIPRLITSLPSAFIRATSFSFFENQTYKVAPADDRDRLYFC